MTQYGGSLKDCILDKLGVLFWVGAVAEAGALAHDVHVFAAIKSLGKVALEAGEREIREQLEEPLGKLKRARWIGRFFIVGGAATMAATYGQAHLDCMEYECVEEGVWEAVRSEEVKLPDISDHIPCCPVHDGRNGGIFCEEHCDEPLSVTIVHEWRCRSSESDEE